MDATAPFAHTWLVVEHPGPWSREALDSASLNREVAEHLRTLVGDGVRVLLVRHVDRPTRAVPTARNVWVARTGTHHAELLHGELDDLGATLEWTAGGLAQGAVASLVPDVGHPLLLVCTNGRRDACCAVEGRALLSALLEESGDERHRIWECSHVGGHRFAPVTLTLPHGAVHGRLSAEGAGDFWHRTRHRLVNLDHLRGMSCHQSAVQAADLAVRRLAAVDAIADLESTSSAREAVVATHRDGRQWQVSVAQTDLDLVRPESCGAEPTRARAWRAVPVEMR